MNLKNQVIGLGNILSDGFKTFQYATVNNYLLGNDNVANQFTYDAHGNMLKMPHLSSMDWDYGNRLISATNGVLTSYYNYDAQGNRTRKVVDRGVAMEERYYIGACEVYRKQVNSIMGTSSVERTTVNIADDEKVFVRVDKETVLGSGIGIGGVTAKTTTRYQFDNHLGSACLELDEDGDIISYEEYHPFGTTSYRAGRSETEVSLKRYKFCGKERDEETGLYYYGARYYAAWLGRFVSCDPMQFNQPDKSPYHYCSNNPVNRIDPTGMQDDEPKKPPSGLSINPNDAQAIKDIKNLADSKRNAKYISFSESGEVTLDFGKLPQEKIDAILQKDSGLALIHELNTTPNAEGIIPSYFYGTQGETGIGLENPDNPKWYKDYYSNISTLDNKGFYEDSFGGYISKAFVLNASVTPFSSDGSEYGLKPVDGYDAKIFIGQGTFANIEPVTRMVTDTDTGKMAIETNKEPVPVSRIGILKHELKESLLRTAFRMTFDAAHNKAGGIGTVDRFYPH